MSFELGHGILVETGIRIEISYRLPSAPLNPYAYLSVTREAVISFDPPVDDGGRPILSYTVVSYPGGLTATGTSSPISIGGLTADVTYTFKVYATTIIGDGPLSVDSNPLTLSIGRLLPLSPPYVTGGSYGLSITPDMKHVYDVYAVTGSPRALQKRSRDMTTGVLSAPTNINTGPVFNSTLTSPDNNNVYATHLVGPDGLGNYTTHVFQYSRNTTTGDLTYMGDIPLSGNSGGTFRDPIISADGKDIYVAANITSPASYRIYHLSRDLGTGALTYITYITTSSTHENLVISNDGLSIYSTSTAYTFCHHARSPSTGVITASTDTTFVYSPTRIIVSTDNKNVYISANGTGYTNRVYQYSRNLSSGDITPCTPAYVQHTLTSYGPPTTGMVCAPTDFYILVGITAPGGTYYIGEYSRNLTTGLISYIGAMAAPSSGLIQIIASSDSNFVYANGSNVTPKILQYFIV